jgi:hypothetical protein
MNVSEIRNLPKAARRLISVLLALGGVVLLASSNRNVLHWFQERLIVIGPDFSVGQASFVRGGGWLLLMNREKFGAASKLYGVVPYPEKIFGSSFPHGRFFSFADLSQSDRLEITFVEADPTLNETMKTWVNRGEAPPEMANFCSIGENFQGLGPSLRCKTGGEVLVYLPDSSVYVVLTSSILEASMYIKPVVH